MGLRRLRGRLDQIQAEANQTMADAQALIAQASKTLTVTEKALLQLVERASGLTVMATSSLAKIMDGVNFEAEVFGKKIPGKIHLNFDDED